MKATSLAVLPLLSCSVIQGTAAQQTGQIVETSSPTEVLVNTTSASTQSPTEIASGSCDSTKIKQDPFIHKSSYIIGIASISDIEQTYAETFQVFSEYLTATAGQKFDPPIEFKIDPNYFHGLFSAIENEEMDFLYANPGVYSCIGAEFGASALATAVSRVETRGRSFDLDVYGGVIAVRQDNDEINTIADLKDKIIGAGSIVDFMGGQMQIYEMEKAGMSYVNDPKQVIFANDQADVVHGIISGRFDVGFIRTNQIELTKNSNGQPVDADLFKIIEAKVDIMDSGELFPFLHSTQITPEWPLAALPSVPGDVQQAVQTALMEFGQYVEIGVLLNDCLASNDDQYCANLTLHEMVPNPPCNATKDLALLASDGAQKSHLAGFRPARSYFEVRTILQEAGFLLNDEQIGWHCTRPEELYEGITCPDGHFKRNKREFDGGCQEVGLACDDQDGYECFCRPCIKAFEVDVYPRVDGEEDPHILLEYYGDSFEGCEKMSICGTFEQGDSITLRIYDNMQRVGAKVEVISHAGDEENALNLREVPNSRGFGYEFTVTDNKVQVHVIEILFDGEPISQSPIRVVVEDKNCDAVYGEGSNRVPDKGGECVCAGNTYEIGDICLDSVYFFLIVFAGVFLVVGILVFFYLGYKKKQSDSIWHINVDELHFNEPPEIIGQGGFGVVILGEYRGTKVAVKRVLPPNKHKSSGSLTGSGTGSAEFIGRRTSIEIRSVDAPKKDAKDVDKKKDKSGMNVKFGENAVDIESQTISKSGTCSNKDWERLINGRFSDKDVFKILESATMSDQGGGAIRSATASQSFFLKILPMWLRFDDHAHRVREFVKEMRMLSSLRHPCITTVMGAVVANRVDPMLVMEYMDYGSLHDLLHNETMTLSGEIILQFVRDIVQGMQFLHASKPPILHGDLKAKNILVDSRFRAKVADFGFSHFRTGKQTNILQGTPFYMAPEYLRRRSEYTQACDIYSFAMILYEIYARAGPFEGEDPRKVLPKVCHPRLNKRPAIPESMPPKIAELMKKCWSANAFFRPTGKDLDYALVELNSQDAEPLETAKDRALKSVKPKTTSLYDVFPKHVADALNAGKKVEAEMHDIVTVIFSDIVGFTTISTQLDGMKISKMLDRLYTAFDALAKRHQIFKVETIGDAYMGVTNLEGNEIETHVKQVAEYAQDAVRAASTILIDEDDPSLGYVQIRVGFHSGPVVSNVIGSLNPRYGLFGDTVNTASRMESNSMAGRIHCSFASAQLLMKQAPDIPVKLRGAINIKGKGKMKTYWIGDDALLKPLAPNLCLSVPEPMGPLTEQSEENSVHGDHTEINKDTNEEWSSNSEAVSLNVDGQSLPSGGTGGTGKTLCSQAFDDTQETCAISESGHESDLMDGSRSHFIKVHSNNSSSGGSKPSKDKIRMDTAIQ